MPAQVVLQRATAWHSRLSPMQWLGVLLAIDLVFVALHISHVYAGAPASTRWSIERDRGYAEFFQYLKFLWVIALLLQTWSQRLREPMLLLWVAVYIGLLLDDSLTLHEGLGVRVAAMLNLSSAWGLRGVDFAELLVVGAGALVVLPVLTAAYWRASPDARRLSHNLALLLAALAACGVGLDTLHSWTLGTRWLHVAGLLEDGGEMLCLSATVAYLLLWARAENEPLAD